MPVTDTTTTGGDLAKIDAVAKGKDKALLPCYVKARSMRLLLYIKRAQVRMVTHLQSIVTATGFAGVGTNKGGLLVAFRYYGTPLAFVASHLAARADEVRS